MAIDKTLGDIATIGQYFFAKESLTVADKYREIKSCWPTAEERKVIADEIRGMDESPE